jgi:serine/threonine-protein kinase HipA
MTSRHSWLTQMRVRMSEVASDPRSISSLDVLLNDVKVGTIVRTPGDFNAFSF